MKLHTLATIALAVLLVSAGAAAATPGNAPDDSNADEHERVSDYRPQGQEEGRSHSGDDAGTGTVVDLPGTVPDHVAAVHDRIAAFLNDDPSDLGSAVSDLVSGDG